MMINEQKQKAIDILRKRYEQQEYSGKTIDNVIQQLDSRRKEMRKKMEGGDT